jgi:acetyltransferase-like isoleucine patch superfamily enzyme
VSGADLLELVLVREDANTEYALIGEWLVEDRSDVRKGQPVCVAETSKASVELDAPGAGTIVRLYPQGTEVELGKAIALIAESADEVEHALRRRDEAAAAKPAAVPAGRATAKAVELAKRHGIDLDSIEKAGFITAQDVEAIVGMRAAVQPGDPELLAGVSTDGVTLPDSFAFANDETGRLAPEFLASLRADSEFRALSSAEKLEAYRNAGAVVGEDVVLGDGVSIDAERIVLGEGVRIGDGATIRCDEVFAAGALTLLGDELHLRCRRAFLGSNIWSDRGIRIGGGGSGDPWATLVIGDLAYLGAEAFVNVCRPVLIGREVFLTQRSMLLTHNVGHSVLEGFENRFAPVVLEDRSQIGLGTVVYAGCRVGRDAIVASNSYVVSDIPPGKLAIGVPARVSGPSYRPLSPARRSELARRMFDELYELLELRGHDVSRLDDGFELRTEEGTSVVAFVERLTSDFRPPEASAETIVLTLDLAAEPPAGCAVLDLIGRRLHGEGGVVLDSVREFCRKRGIRFEPGPWRYAGGLV